jgi:hypothetical protein
VYLTAARRLEVKIRWMEEGSLELLDDSVGDLVRRAFATEVGGESLSMKEEVVDSVIDRRGGLGEAKILEHECGRADGGDRVGDRRLAVEDVRR